jgi:lipid II:glycine glycyltransferase (peptidoglycan interpeptide bridge formation enzyme)
MKHLQSRSWLASERDREHVEVWTEPDAEQISRWDNLVKTTAGSDVSQLSSWARVRATVGYAPLYLLAFSERRLVGGAQVLHRRIPIVGSVAYLPFGPVIETCDASRPRICAQLGETLTTLARHKFHALFVRPPDSAHDVSRDLLGRGFRPTDPRMASGATLRLDLTASESELRAKLGRRLRYWTNQWAGRGVRVREGNLSDVDLLVQLMAHTGRHQGYRPPSAKYVHAMCRELMPGGHAALFVGEVDGNPVGADLLTVCGGVVKGRLTGFDRSGDAGRLSVPAAIRWHAILWAKASGKRWFDFGGIRDSTFEDMAAGDLRNRQSWPSTDRAKISFGGAPYRYPQLVELIRPAPLVGAYDVLRNVRAGELLLDRMYDNLRGSGHYGKLAAT